MIKFFIFFISLNISAQDLNNEFQVSFQDGFDNDVVSLKVENCGVIRNKILKSREIGFTGVRIEFYSNKITVFENRTIIYEEKCSLNLNKDLKLHLILNNNKSKILINVNKGKYIGLSKNIKKDQFKFQQINRPFEYD